MRTDLPSVGELFQQAQLPRGAKGLRYLATAAAIGAGVAGLSHLQRAVARALGRGRQTLLQARYRSAAALLHQPRANDIFIVSYPKAGTTVMQMLLHQITTPGGIDFPHIDNVVPWFDVNIVQRPASLAAMPALRAFKTHLPFGELPKGARYIYLLRNPKDTCISYYYHLMNGERFPLSQFVEAFVKGELPWGSWFDHFSACARARASREVLLVGYDEIVSGLPEVVDRVAIFCGVALSSSKRADVLDRCSLGKMREHQRVFDPRFMHMTALEETTFDPRFMQRAQRPEQRDFIRKGVSGEWVHELSPALAAVIDRRMERTVSRLGSVVSSRELELATAPASPVRGTVAVLLGGRSASRLLYDAAASPAGLSAAGGCEGLEVGDRVEVRIWLAPEESVTVQQAEVVALAGGGVGGGTLRFVNIEPCERQRLDALSPPPAAAGPMPSRIAAELSANAGWHQQ